MEELQEQINEIELKLSAEGLTAEKINKLKKRLDNILTVKKVMDDKDKVINDKDKVINDKDKVIENQNQIIKNIFPSTPNTPTKYLKPSFSTNGAIQVSERNTKYFHVHRDHQKITEMIEEGMFGLLYGPRSSSKTTTIFDIMDHYKNSVDYHFLYISISPHRFSDETTFWEYFYKTMKDFCSQPESTINGRDIFLTKNNFLFGGKKLVVIMDEFNILTDKFPSTLIEIRDWKQIDTFNVKSCFGVGTFEITRFSNEGIIKSISPFNVSEHISISPFNLDQVRILFSLFTTSKNIKIDGSVIENIFDITQGHPGLVNLCGRSIDENLKTISRDTTITIDIWENYLNEYIYNRLFQYQTVINLVNILDSSSQDFRDTLYNYIIHFPSSIENSTSDPKILTKLISHGYINQISETEHRLSSRLMKSCILLRFGNFYKRSIPKEAFPMNFDVPAIVEAIVPLFLFSKDFPTKHNRGKNSQKDLKVPSEFFYHLEFLAVLHSWVAGLNIKLVPNVSVGSRMRADICLKHSENKFILELCAHIPDLDIQEHITRCQKYKQETSAQQAWVINFTIGSESENFKYLKSSQHVGIIHVYHSTEFNSFEFVVHHPTGKK